MWLEGPVEGDYLETKEGLLFTVKGLIHPKGLVIAYLRYIPDLLGDRERNGIKYRRVYDVQKTTRYLKDNYPEYLNEVESKKLILQSVPINLISKIYKPQQYLQEIIENPETRLQKIAALFSLQVAKESSVSIGSIGLTGSSLIGLENDQSDLDFISYGENESRKIYRTLSSLRSNKTIHAYDEKLIRHILNNRWGDTGLNLDEFRDIELNKILHGVAYEREYFWRLLKPPKVDEVSKPVGRKTIIARITCDRDSIFTPCKYKVETISGHAVSEIVSYRGKFTEQAKTGYCVKSRGTLEEVSVNHKVYFRLVLGSPGDYMLPY